MSGPIDAVHSLNNRLTELCRAQAERIRELEAAARRQEEVRENCLDGLNAYEKQVSQLEAERDALLAGVQAVRRWTPDCPISEGAAMMVASLKRGMEAAIA